MLLEYGGRAPGAAERASAIMETDPLIQELGFVRKFRGIAN